MSGGDKSGALAGDFLGPYFPIREFRNDLFIREEASVLCDQGPVLLKVRFCENISASGLADMFNIRKESSLQFIPLKK